MTLIMPLLGEMILHWWNYERHILGRAGEKQNVRETEYRRQESGVLVFVPKDGTDQLSRTVPGEWLGQSHCLRLYPGASLPHTALLRHGDLPGTAGQTKTQKL